MEEFAASINDDDSDDVIPIYSLDPEEKVVMCCCKRNEPHDEKMKFILKCRKENEADLSQPLFINREEGRVTELNDRRKKFHLKYDTEYQEIGAIGRSKEIQECVERITNEKELPFILIEGEQSIGKYTLAKYAIKYCVERNYFEDGAFEIEAEKLKTWGGIQNKICQIMKLND